MEKIDNVFDMEGAKCECQYPAVLFSHRKVMHEGLLYFVQKYICPSCDKEWHEWYMHVGAKDPRVLKYIEEESR